MNTQIETQLSYLDMCKLDEFLFLMQADLEKAENIIHDIQEEYFGITEEAQKEEDYWRIKSGYNTYRIRTDIVSDYLFELRKMVITARKYSEKFENFVPQ